MAPFERSMEMKPFKQRKCLATRKHEVCSIRSKFPNKLPVIVERYIREKQLPLLDKSKFLYMLHIFFVPSGVKSTLDASQVLYLLVSEKSLSCMSASMGEVYSQYRDPRRLPVHDLRLPGHVRLTSPSPQLLLCLTTESVPRALTSVTEPCNTQQS
uniref:Uncharacterized protein n=1 Tax=Denticeps clupeoides TaxID=299321 RepID=A0AAY4CEY9_9TELE